MLEDREYISSLTRLEFIELLAKFLSQLNAIHPFREGNGRTQLAFLAMLCADCRKPISLTKIRPARFLSAMIESFSFNLEPLKSELALLFV